MATATAVRDARTGLRVLIVSTDQAHSIGDVLGTPVTPTGRREPTRVLADRRRDAGGGFLDALALDTLALLEARWREIAGLLAGRFPESDLGDIAPEELSALPGIQEVLGLHEVGELAGSGRMGPRRGGLRVDRRCAADADAARDVRPVPGAGVAAASPALDRRRRRPRGGDRRAASSASTPGTEQLGSLLTDGERVSAHLVMTAERVVAAEAVRTLGSLALMGVQVAELIVNQILVQDDSYEYRNLPEHPAFDWYSERISEQQAVLDELDTTIGDVQLVLVPHLAGEPIGAKALGELLDVRTAARRLAAARAVAADRRPGIRIWARGGIPVAARVAAGRLRRVDAWAGSTTT